ncbi:MAG TPA: cache domain-containing protein [Anaerovoracaceae bacterium]|nr:cache domain-containing protein [Anaerovoracaceae bacterium]
MNHLSLKQKYFFSITLVCLISLAIVSAVSYMISYQLVLNSTTSKIEMASKRYSNEIDAWLMRQMNDLNNIKDNVEFNSGYYDDAHISAMLSQKLKKTDGQVLDYYIGFNDKRLLSGTGWVPTEDYDCTQRDWFKQAINLGGTVITLPYVDSDSKKMVITISEPLTMNNQVVGVLAVDITVDYLVKLVNSIKISDGSYAFLIDNEKNIMTYPEQSLQPTEKTSYRIDQVLDGRFSSLSDQINRSKYKLTKLTDYDGKEKYFYLSEISSSRWILGFSIPTSEITNNLHALLLGFAYACGISIVISMIVIFALLSGLLRPVMHLTKVVKQFGAKNMDARCEIRSNDEIGELGRSFNSMADTIQNYSLTLENKVLERTKELNEKNAKIQDSIEYAKMIQQTILPDDAEISKTLKDYFIIWRPRDIVGGDLYWMRKFDDGFTIAVGDCTGHGVPGALMTMAVNAILDRIVDDMCHDDPALILNELNRLLNQTLSKGSGETELQDGMDAGVIYVSNRGEILYSGARISLFMIKDGESSEMKGISYTIGTDKNHKGKSFINHRVQLNPEMSFYLATDGFKDQVGGERRLPFGKKGMLAVLKSIQQCTMEEQKEIIWSTYEDYKKDEILRDDVTMFGFRL